MNDGYEIRGANLLPPRQHFQWVHDHLQIVLGPDVTFAKAVAYAQGFDDATNAMDGFHLWLADRLGSGRSLHWRALVQYEHLGIAPAHHQTEQPADWTDRLAEADGAFVDRLFTLLDEFLASTRWAEEIRWHLYLNTAKAAAADVVINRIWKLLEVKGTIVSLETYWKDETKIDARLSTPIPAADAARVSHILLQAVGRLTHGVRTAGPQKYDDDRFEMSVLSDSGFADPGISWLEATVRNFE